MVRLPDDNFTYLDVARARRRARGLSEQQEREYRRMRESTHQRVRVSSVRWGVNESIGPYGEIECVDDNGTTYKTAKFPLPAGISDITNENAHFTQHGDIVSVRLSNGTHFDIQIQGMEQINNSCDTSHNLIRGMDGWGFVVDEAGYYDAGSCGEGINRWWRGKKTIKLPKSMKCAFCNEHIHYPENLLRLLGENGTKDYLKYCKKSKTKPQLFCCSCFDFIKDKPKIYGALNKLNEELKKFVNINEKEKDIIKREKELDRQLNKLHKKQK